MHYYPAIIYFQRIYDKNLVAEIKVLRPEQKLLLDCKNLADSLLDNCFNNAKGKVEGRTKGAHFYLTSDGWPKIKKLSSGELYGGLS